jgi:hypothetical protein
MLSSPLNKPKIFMNRRSIYSLFATSLLLWLSTITVFAQTSDLDSVKILPSHQQIFDRQQYKSDSIQLLLGHRADSLQNDYQSKLDKADSLQKRLQRNNIIQDATNKIDSLQTSFYQRSDSLKNSLENKLRFWEKAESKLQAKKDSLSSRNLPTDNVKQKMDSIGELRNQTVGSFNKKLQSLKENTSKKINELDLPSEAKDKVAALTKNMDAVNLLGTDSKIPGVGTIPNPLDKAGSIGEIKNIPATNSGNSFPIGHAAKKLDDINPSGISDTKQIADINGKGANVQADTEKVSGYSKDAAQVAKGNVDEVKNLPKTAEEKAANVSGIKTAEQQTKQLEEYKNMTAKMKDQEAIKKEAMEKAKKVSVDHFAGKETQLKAAMEKVAKYKQKYSSLNGVKELSKRAPNQMRDKPPIERIVTGLAIQFQKRGDNLLVDFNPYAGYRFTGRIRAGVGWNQRVACNTTSHGLNSTARIFGPRVFGEFKLAKGFSPRGEVEVMNTTVPPLLAGPNDPQHREWVWGAFVGIKKEYKLWKNVKGTAMVMGRVFNEERKSPYADVLNVRFGFELPMKKKV